MAAARAFPINRPHPSHKHRRKHNGKHRPVRVVAAVASDRPLKPIDSTMKSKYLLVVYAAFLIIFLVQFAGKTVPHHLPDVDSAKPASHMAMCAAMLHSTSGWDDPRYRLLCEHTGGGR